MTYFRAVRISLEIIQHFRASTTAQTEGQRYMHRLWAHQLAGQLRNRRRGRVLLHARYRAAWKAYQYAKVRGEPWT